MNGLILKLIGVGCLAIALWMFLRGHDIANSIGSQVTRAFTGEPTGKASHYYLAAIITALLGGFLIFWKRKKA